MTEAINHEICPMTGTILSEKTYESQELNRTRSVSRELNFDFAQFFYPQEKRKIFEIRHFQSEITDENGNKQVISATVKPDATLGTLTTFDERVFYACVEIWEIQGRSSRVVFSEREIARRTGVKWGRDTAKAINESLRRLRLVGIDWEGSFFAPTSKSYLTRVNPFTVLNHLDIKSTCDKGIGKQECVFSFDDRVLESLNNSHFRPVRFDVILSFRSPLAQALYTLLDRKLYGTKEYHRTTAGLLLDDLNLIGKSYKRKSKRVEYLNRVRNELLNAPTSYGEVIEKYEIEAGRDDALLRVTRSGASRIKGQKLKVLEALQPKPSKSRQKAQQASEKPKPTLTLTPTKEKPSGAKSEALEVLAYFDEVFGKGGDGDKQYSRSAVAKASAFIKRDGLEKTKFLIDFARGEAPKTNYEPKTFNGITHYREEALKAWKANIRLQKRLEQEAEQVAKRRREDARLDHEKIYRDDYYEYVNELICSLGDEYPSRFNEFRCWQAEQRREKENLEGNLREVSLRVFDSEGQSILRLTQFFQDDPDIHIPDFWQWDCQENPHRFTTDGEGGTFPKKILCEKVTEADRRDQSWL